MKLTVLASLFFLTPFLAIANETVQFNCESKWPVAVKLSGVAIINTDLGEALPPASATISGQVAAGKETVVMSNLQLVGKYYPRSKALNFPPQRSELGGGYKILTFTLGDDGEARFVLFKSMEDDSSIEADFRCDRT